MTGIVCSFLYSHGNGPLARCLDVYSELSRSCREVQFNLIIPERELSSAQHDYLSNSAMLTANVKVFLSPDFKEILEPLQELGSAPFHSISGELLRRIRESQKKLDQLAKVRLKCYNADGSHLSIVPSEIDFFIVREIPLIPPAPAYDISYGPQSAIYSYIAKDASILDARCNAVLNLISRSYLMAEQSRRLMMVSVPSSLTWINVDDNSVVSLSTVSDRQQYVLPVTGPLSIFDGKTDVRGGTTPAFVSNFQRVYIYISGTKIQSTRLESALTAPQLSKCSLYGNQIIDGLVYKESVVPPSDILDISPDFVIARAGWGMVWHCLIHLMPLVLINPTEFDDPEIFCNHRTLISSGLALCENELYLSQNLLAEKLTCVVRQQWLTLRFLESNLKDVTAARAIMQDKYYGMLLKNAPHSRALSES